MPRLQSKRARWIPLQRESTPSVSHFAHSLPLLPSYRGEESGVCVCVCLCVSVCLCVTTSLCLWRERREKRKASPHLHHAVGL